jgi:hypothetical protein
LENILPKAGLDYMQKIACINNMPNETKHYDPLLQVLAELQIVHNAATLKWGENVELEYELSTEGSQKNPELLFTTEDVTISKNSRYF